MPESIFIPLIDNGGRLVRMTWAASMFHLGMSGVLGGRRIVYETFSHPDPSACMNLATASFLASGLDRMLVIDADHIFTPQDVGRLLAHDLPLVSGLYVKKVAGYEYPVLPLDASVPPKSLFDKSAECPVEVQCVPRGFISIHRSVFETLKPHVPHYDEGEFEVGIYWQSIPGTMSEDFAFCKLYREHGGRVWLDHSIFVQHEGSAIYPLKTV